MNKQIILSKKERKQIIRKISRASGVAQYALEAKTTDEQIIELSKHLEILKTIKAANDYNRYCQGQKTAEANAKLREFIDIHNSEIYKAGKWLLDALSLTGKHRQEKLAEKELLHLDEHKEAVSELTTTIEEIEAVFEEQTILASQIINQLEQTNDNKKKQLTTIRDYIVNNYGNQMWRQIQKYI